MDRGHDEKANMDALYEASRDGCVSTLTTLIQRDALILDRVLLTSFRETPLHIAALLGHFEFSKALLSKKPKLAEEVDSLGRIPLHLASAEGHTEIVRALLLVNTDVCVIRDQDDSIPLHLAAMRGRIETMRLLIHAQPTSIMVNLNGDSVLHLCVRNNHLEALKLLVESANGDQSFLSSKDRDDNSILHLAVMLKQMKVINYLLSVPEIKREANSKNKDSQTALDVLEASNVYPRDFKYAEIKNILKEAGVKKSIDDQSRLKRGWRCIRSSLGSRFKDQGKWIDDIRGSLMVVATVMATMAFQVGVNPPGGVWQEDVRATEKGRKCSVENLCEAGTAVLSYSWPTYYQFLLKFNTTSFIASVCVVLLVISGFPLTSRFSVWLLSLTMTTSVVFMTLTYLYALTLITSFRVLDDINKFSRNVTKVWIAVVVISGVLQIIRPLCWMVNKLRKYFKRKSTKAPTKDPANV